MTGASVGIYIGLYAFYYLVFVAKMDMLAGELIYFVYTILATYSMCVLCGMISVVASHLFVRSIYDSIRSD